MPRTLPSARPMTGVALPGALGRGARSVQLRLGASLRDRVAGPDAVAAHARIWDTPGPRWFTPNDPIWQVHSDASMFPGGIAALLLQSLHPLAMAGVAGHSGYRSDPWGRLQRTSHYLATTTFGTIEHAEAAIDTVRAVHLRVRGRAPDGRPYQASDPDLLRWVHIAEVWSFLHAHRAFGTRSLSLTAQDRYVAQAGRAATLLGARDVPQSVGELERSLAQFRPELAATTEALDAAAFLLHDPPLPIAARPGYDLLARGAQHILPAWAREQLDLPLPRLAGVSGQVGTRAVRWGMAAFG